MARVTVHHLTRPRRPPLIEEEGLRTRADLSGLYGPPGPFDTAAPGTFAHGKRVSGWLSAEHARAQVAEFGAGYVSYSVDPRKTLAARASTRASVEPAEYWASRSWELEQRLGGFRALALDIESFDAKRGK